MRKVIKALSYILAAVCLTIVIGCALLIEPCVKIKGFVELDNSILENIKNTLVINGIEDSVWYTPIKDINSDTINAFLCAEDKRFFEHEGIDYFRILTAAVSDLKDGSFNQGASTITQQLIKNTHLSGEKSLKRKIQEIRLSRAVERKYTKKEILEMYLNILYFGNGIYGIGAAARNYFDKSVSELTAKESAILASIINNPQKYNPYLKTENLSARTSLILGLMRKNGKLSEAEYARAKSETVAIKQMSLFDKYKYFVIDEATNILGCTKEHLYRGNYRIVCNQDAYLQNKLKEYLMPSNHECAQIIVIDNATGKIIAHEAKYAGNPATVMRSPASTIKPLVCYAPALEKGIIVPLTPILDEKTSFDGYSPSNYKDEYHGYVSCEFALKQSLNIPAVKLLDEVGLDYGKSFLRKIGISCDDEGLALSLGGMKYGVRLKELTSAYTAFPRGGTKINCSYISAIYRDGKEIYRADKSQKRVMKEETAYFINEMLNKCAANGTAKLFNTTAFNVAAKTGTVGDKDGNTDAYCIAYNKRYTVGVHIMDNEKSSVMGGGEPTKIAKSLIMRDIISTEKFDTPKNIVKIDINAPIYNATKKIVKAEKSLPKKDRITASFPIYNLPATPDERSDYEKGLDFFDMNDFLITDGFGY